VDAKVHRRETNWKRCVHDYVRLNTTGSFGCAFLATRRSDDARVVIKQCEAGGASEAEREATLNEVRVLSQLRHENIVRYFESFFEKGKLFIVMEYAEKGGCTRHAHATPPPPPRAI
jgi:serine/threonine protein kinase